MSVGETEALELKDRNHEDEVDKNSNSDCDETNRDNNTNRNSFVINDERTTRNTVIGVTKHGKDTHTNNVNLEDREYSNENEKYIKSTDTTMTSPAYDKNNKNNTEGMKQNTNDRHKERTKGDGSVEGGKDITTSMSHTRTTVQTTTATGKLSNATNTATNYVAALATTNESLTDNKQNKNGLINATKQTQKFNSTTENAMSLCSSHGTPRATWSSRAQFVLACIGSCVGLGNFWRFPYLCYKSGGGAFLIPYTVMVVVCGVPLLLMEMAMGQYTRRGPVGALQQLCPIFVGAGVGVVVICIIFCSYYNVVIAWSLFYLVQSFRDELPWTGAGIVAAGGGGGGEVRAGSGGNNTLGGNQTHGCLGLTSKDVMEPRCFGNESFVSTDLFGSNVSWVEPATQHYFDTEVLQRSTGLEEFGGLVWPLFAAVSVAWLLVYFSIWKSVKSSGMVVVVTATVPFLFLFVFVVRAVTLPGASTGLLLLFSPDWPQLLSPKVWVNAAAQIFNSLGIGFGSMITFSSYNKISNNLLTDVWVIAIVNSATSILAGIIVFSTMGNIALEMGRNITDVVAEGPGLVFVVYPQALAQMPYPRVFSALFFTMLIMLGIDSQFATVEVVVTSLRDALPSLRLRQEFLVLFVCLACFLLGLPHIFQGGIYFFTLVDYYSAALSLMFLALAEVVAVVWCYGADRLARNVYEMTGQAPSLYFTVCWRYLAPALILVVGVFAVVGYVEPTYGSYNFPPAAIALGWFITSLSLLPIPIAAAVMLWRDDSATLLLKFRSVAKPRVGGCVVCQQSVRSPATPCHCRCSAGVVDSNCEDVQRCSGDSKHHYRAISSSHQNRNVDSGIILRSARKLDANGSKYQDGTSVTQGSTKGCSWTGLKSKDGETFVNCDAV